MSTFLPNGYTRWVPTFTLDGSIKIFQTVFMVSNAAETSPNIMDTLMRSWFCAAGGPFVATNMFVGFTLAKTESWTAIGGDVLYAINETAIVGSKAGSSSSPINTSTLVKKNTGLSGRLYRGRHMLPNLTVSEANISQAGIIDSTGIATLQGQWNTAMSAVTVGTHDLYLGHSSSEVAPTIYTTVTVTPKVGSMPHRIR
jgi:hypothetical protein